MVTIIPAGDDSPNALFDFYDESTRYAYLLDHTIRVGTFAQYLKDWADAYYSGVEISEEIRTWDDCIKVIVNRRGTDSDGYAVYELTTMLGHTAHVQLDGTA